MPKDRDKHREYMRKYMLERYHRRRSAAMVSLGGSCVDCGSIDNLELDHMDRREKSFCIAKALAGFSESRVAAELKKCVLRCKDCHKKKTLAEVGKVSARTTHGTLSSYRYCKCKECRKANADYSRSYKSRESGQ